MAKPPEAAPQLAHGREFLHVKDRKGCHVLVDLRLNAPLATVADRLAPK